MRLDCIYGFLCSAAISLFGCIALSLLTFVCFRFHADTTTVGFLYLIVIVLVSLKGGYVPSLLVSIIAFLCLAFFSIPPIFSFAMDTPADRVASVLFLTTSIVISHLVSKDGGHLRKSKTYDKVEAHE